MQPLSGREAKTRFVGVLALLAVGYLHLLDISHKVEEGIWYMVLGFTLLIMGSVVLAVKLVRDDDLAVRFAWVGAAALSAGALFGYFVSRTVPLPGMADHQGDWANAVGVLAGFAEIALIVLVGFALRDRVLRLSTQRREQSRRPMRGPRPALGSLAGLLALAPLTAVLASPDSAPAHGGEDDEGTGEAVVAAKGGGGDTMAQEGAMHDASPFLGTAELGIALAAAGTLIAWAGSSLRARTAAGPARGGVHRRAAARPQRRLSPH
ncbi:hypothetical protein BH20ACT15_BH20ACT15_07000 [soil metagenome]